MTEISETFDLPTLLIELTRDEGRHFKPYIDTVGKTTIGVGRNLEDVGISEHECDMLLQNDIARTVAWLDQNVCWWRDLDVVRQRVMINMTFNLGSRLLTFANMLTAAKSGDYAVAADAMLTSKWATQVGARAQRLANLMRTGNNNAQ